MKVIRNKRSLCKSDFILISDDKELLESYEKMYTCEIIDLFRRKKITNEEDFTKTYEILKQQGPKEFCCACYIQKTCAVYYILPGSQITHKLEVRPTIGSVTTNVLQIMENLMYMTLQPENGILGLHGAAVAREDTAYLLLGKTFTGKSTLAVFLCMAGYEYITDDEIFISETTLRVQPVYKIPSVRPGGFGILQNEFEGKETPSKILDRAKRVVNGSINAYLLNLTNKNQYQEYKIGGIIFLNGYGSSEPYIKKLDAISGFTRLLKGQLVIENEKSSPKDVPVKYQALAALAKNTYEMRFDDLWTAETFLKHLPQ